MIHGPCGAEKPNAPCMYNNQGEITSVCHKSLQNSTINKRYGMIRNHMPFIKDEVWMMVALRWKRITERLTIAG